MKPRSRSRQTEVDRRRLSIVVGLEEKGEAGNCSWRGCQEVIDLNAMLYAS